VRDVGYIVASREASMGTEMVRQAPHGFLEKLITSKQQILIFKIKITLYKNVFDPKSSRAISENDLNGLN
jgi:hypothetical protein